MAGWRAGESRAWTSPSSAVDPTGWRPPSSAPGPVFRCRCSRRNRRRAEAPAPSPTPSSPAWPTTSARPCTRWRWRRRFSRSSICRPAGCTLKVPEVSYANPLPGRPAAVGYHDLDRTCAELDDGESWRRLLGPLVERDDAVLKLLPRRQTLASHRSDCRGPDRHGDWSNRAPRRGARYPGRTPVRCSPALPHTRFRRCRRWCRPARG